MTKRLSAVFVLALMLGGVTLVAHGGHDHRIRGIVTARHENHLGVKTTDGKTASIRLDTNTKYRRGKAKATEGDLQVGDRVVVIVGDGKDALVAKEVRLGVSASKPAKPTGSK